MSGGIFMVKSDETLLKMNGEPFESENIFQELLARYPDLLAGDQINQAAPRQWLLVKREAGIPDEESGGARWSLDHLFIDQDGIPTLVEVKRATDTRLRREVVAQMLDYAANAVVYWPHGKIRSEFEARCKVEDINPDEHIRECFDGELESEELWSKVKTNLQAERIRMIFIADFIPDELRRIVEFLNGQMDPAEVIAVEIKHFKGEGHRVLVPRVLGQTAEAVQRKGTPARRKVPWTEKELIAKLQVRGIQDEVEVAEKLIGLFKTLKLEPTGGKAATASISYSKDSIKPMYLLYLWESYKQANIQIGFERISRLDGGTQIVNNLCEALNKINGLNLEPTQKWPSIQLLLLKDAVNWNVFKTAVEELLAFVDQNQVET